MKKILTLSIAIIIFSCLLIPSAKTYAEPLNNWDMFKPVTQDEIEMLKKADQKGLNDSLRLSEYYESLTRSYAACLNKEIDLTKDTISLDYTHVMKVIIETESNFKDEKTYNEILNANKYRIHYFLPLCLNGEPYFCTGFGWIENDKGEQELVRADDFLFEDFFVQTEYGLILASLKLTIDKIGIDNIKNINYIANAPYLTQKYVIDSGKEEALICGLVQSYKGKAPFLDPSQLLVAKLYTPAEYAEYVKELDDYHNNKGEGDDGGAGGPGTLDSGIIIYSISALLFGTIAIALTKRRAKA